MNRLVTRLLAGMAAVAFGIVALATTVKIPAFAQAPQFGSPPSGEVPILYNDQHVYTKPDRLKRNRVLAALVRGSTVLIPLRSMFEQMGATVSYDPRTKTVDVSKSGADVQVTVGKPEVIINGETRPLDVPPEIYKGAVVVPVRVISEGMGAYVQWVPDKRLVVVRYLPAPAPTPPPTAPPTAAPTTAPTPAPSPSPSPTPGPRAQFFIVADAIYNPQVYNEFSPGNIGGVMPGGRIGIDFPINQLSLMAEGTYSAYRYPHRGSANFAPGTSCVPGPGSAAGDQGCVTVIGGNGQVFVPSTDLIDRSIDGRIGIGIAKPKIYLVGAYTNESRSYGYPALTGIGGGIEKLPSLNNGLSFYGSLLYFPQVKGSFTDPFGNSIDLEYRLLKWQGGVTYSVPHTPVFLDVGYQGDHGTNKVNAPGDFTHRALYGGLGLHF